MTWVEWTLLVCSILHGFATCLHEEALELSNQFRNIAFCVLVMIVYFMHAGVV